MSDTTLVLGGGGPVGGAWMIGVLAGLADSGVDVTRATTLIGTSAGAIFGSRLAAGESPGELYARQLAGADRVDLGVTAGQTLRFLWAALGSRDPERSVRRLGRAALAARTGADRARVLETVGTLLRDAEDWPAGRALRITAVDAHDGHVHAFDADSGLPLLEAVAASCAVPLVWPPAHAAGRRWIDGGSRSTTNLQLAHGHRRILAVAPIPAAVGPHPHAEEQAARLTAEGSGVTLITPDRASRRAMGRDMASDPRRPAAARAGHAQAVAVAHTVADAWRA
ncbi:patatin-like phospholipase family protein [Streptomyces sp. NPDC006645]|uniref:patatin-like phospholipase family protein n=1 Tax=unclassified Streptomyces TaxID=2593676 RepID=UPI0033AAD753